ncbi:serine hydrolase [Limoniibacter endophyticus]|uniref:beta-lactamase n=1 Tax=Limoniibacter endophyticus TaxID=1565040 RepID=A0A8J3DL01_9HYPH|nr:serine hydrolase [Limoniibacter endophyticus]GHC78879.1 beta-lactamase [Limoniibacter endophyticus]
MIEPHLPNLIAEIRRIAAIAKGEIGVGALHLESRRGFTVNDDQMFPPGSAVKVPLALAVLDRVDRGEISLDDMVEVLPMEMNPMAPGGLGEQFVRPGIALSVYNHIEGMITRSCNTSTDVCFRIAGGADRIAAWMAGIGLVDFQVSRTMRYALAVMHDLPLPPEGVSMQEVLQNATPEILDARNNPNARFRHEERDHCRPSAMIEVMRRIAEASDGVSKLGRRTMLDIMEREVHSDLRARARLPHGVKLAGKTGSGAGTATNSGLVTLPEGRGTLALALFVKSSRADMATRNSVIADVARVVVDYYLITTYPKVVAPSADSGVSGYPCSV